MQHSQNHRAAREDDKTDGHRKRKLLHSRPSSTTPADLQRSAPDDNGSQSPTPKQQTTISELFQQKPATARPANVPSPKGHKRIKPNPAAGSDVSSPPRSVDSPRSTASASLPTATAAHLPAEKMYSFPSKKPNGAANNVIDLTGKTPSPSPSPARNNGGPIASATTRNNINNSAHRPNFNPNTGAKQLVVKNLRKTPRTDPKEYFNQVWGWLDEALAKIFAGKEIDFSLETLYRGVENVCRQGHAAELAARLQKRCEAYVETGLKAGLLEKAEKPDMDVLRAVLSAWRTWTANQKPIRWIFCYLDRSYLLQQGRTLQDQAFALFRTIVCEDATLKPKLVAGACELVQADRTGEELDKETFRDAISMCHDLTIYTSFFEPKLLEISQQFVADWAEQASQEKGLAEYVQSAVQLMEKEMERCEHFNLDSTTRRDLLALLEDHLVQRQESRLVNQDEVADLLDENAVSDLEQLYKLLDRRRLGAKLRPAFEKWIDLTGTSIVFDDKEQENMVVKLLTLKKQLDAIWRVSYHRNAELGHGLREAFEAFINKSKKTTATWNTDNSKPGEMIAKYVDMLLRGGAKAIPTQLSSVKAEAEHDENEEAAFDEDTEINNQLDQVLDLFRFVHGKAVFEAFYKKDLARRLLMGRSASADAERSMLARLKTECGAGFTQNLEQMFKDVELSREEMASYKSLLEERGDRAPVDLSVSILSASAWPTYPDIPVIIPAEIQQSLDKFTTHYKNKHSGRKLDWKHALAHCQIKAAFPKGNKELVVSSFQAIVLVLFNTVKTGEHLSYDFLKAETGLPEPELQRTLQSLACAKLRPLTKHPKGRDINATDTFTYNAAFHHEKYRLKVNQVQLKETKEENKETHERVAADRNFETQAAIVRIMKSRKRIGHAELVAEVINATKKRGVLSVQDIKKNIDRLVDKDYMEREENNEYSYIA
ncbi:ubiquitin ligase subunit [Diplodia corticola]|uniref:Ubiquitin ligase subunit n=1 Tax=Diplodia corticola TaxID=236234 RepID=A0A1J9QRW3_9PEZI|nr:ubiquitin ligase subunit [Diplodia corticola]OJD31192.1 ubiquitin ligase subunit [Diplodia corticola]